jgi:hypothetical protein
MPHNVQVWPVTRQGKLILHVDEKLITDEGARYLEAAFSLASCHWNGQSEQKRLQRNAHTG